MRPIYLYVHIPKTGGSSVMSNLGMQMGDRMRRQRNKDELISGDTTAIDLVIGHRVSRSMANLFPGREPRFVTVLREPAAHITSRYNWSHHLFTRGEHREPRDLKDWLKKSRNPQARWLVTRFNDVSPETFNNYKPRQLLREAQEILKRFWLIADAENLGETLLPLSEALGISCDFSQRGKEAKVSGTHFDRVLQRSPETDGQIRLTCAVDLALYTEHSSKPVETDGTRVNAAGV